MLDSSRLGSFNWVLSRRAAYAFFTAALGMGFTGCLEGPTEVVVDVYTDLPCEKEAAIVVGDHRDLGDRPAGSVSTQCDPETGYLGRVVIVPESSDSSEFAFEVRVSAEGGAPDECLASNDYNGCIVARRLLNFLPHRSIRMRVDLRNPCVNTPCDETTTCLAQGLSKACVTAKIDPADCLGEACDDEVLLNQDETTFDPCAPASNPCPPEASCSYVDEETSCSCPDGTTLVSEAGAAEAACEDIDECEEGLHDCSPHAACTNTEGGFECECLPAYSGDGESCEQVECTQQCATDATCREVDGDFRCRCDAGFSGDGVTSCQDVDECDLGTDDCDDTAGVCTNTTGSFSCSCASGFEGDGTTCTDIDECDLGTDDCADTGGVCTNTTGSFSCSCASGFEGDGTTCTDVDECDLGTDDCEASSVCRNTPGSYACDYCGSPTVFFTADTASSDTDLIAGLTGSLQGDAALGGEGSVSGGFDFTTSGSYFQVPDAEAIDVGTGDFTLAAWIKGFPANNLVTVIMDKRQSENIGYHWWVYNGKLGARLDDGPSGNNFFSPLGDTPLVSGAEWRHAVMAVDRDDPSGLAFYVDGVPAGTLNPTGISGSLSNTGDLYIGGHSDGSGSATGIRIDEYMTFKSALSAEQVANLYTAMTSGGACR